jgi:hypothetical protein
MACLIDSLKNHAFEEKNSKTLKRMHNGIINNVAKNMAVQVPLL